MRLSLPFEGYDMHKFVFTKGKGTAICGQITPDTTLFYNVVEKANPS
jgi:hypothetical protein